MERREALKTLGIAAAGLVALPSWASGWTTRSVALNSSTFSDKEQVLISAVADTFIPGKNSVGAVPLGVDKFLIRLFDECYEEEVRSNIKLQLAELNKKAMNSTGRPFADCNQAQREELLLSFPESGSDSGNRFFELMKGETIRGFRTSRVVMEDYYGYQVTPGRYYGNTDVEA